MNTSVANYERSRKRSPELAQLLLKQEMLRREQVELDQEVLPGDLRRYSEAGWKIIEPGTPFLPNWHIDAICEHLEACITREIRNLVISMPPRHLKSNLVSVMFPTYVWIKHPEERFLYSSYGMSLAIRDSLKSRRVIQSDWYRDRWGDKFFLTGDQNAKMRYENDHTGYRIATSVGGIGTGEGGGFIIVDDPHNVLEAESELKRQSTLDWWDGTMSTRGNDPKTVVRIIIAQRTHHKDLLGHVLEQGGYEHLNLPAEYEGRTKATVIGWKDPRTKKGELLHGARFGKKELDELKLRLGPYRASGQLQQRPTPESGGIFKRSYFRLWPPDRKLPGFHYIIQSYDTAFTDKTDNDPSAMTAWGLFKYKKLWNVMLLDAWKEYLSYPKLRRRVKLDRKAKYGEDGQESPVDEIIIEEKGSGITLIQDLGMIGVAAFPYNPHRADKVVRAHASTPFGAAGLIWVMESRVQPGFAASWAQPVLDEAMKFPKGDEDDYTDTITQAIIFLRNKGLLDAKVLGEEGDDIDGIEASEYDRPKHNPYAE